jgi:zinc transporter ZupT
LTIWYRTMKTLMKPRKVEDITEDSPPENLPDHLTASSFTVEGGTAALTPAGKAAEKSKLLRAGLFTALAVAIHNFPEGFATFYVRLRDPSLGISIAIAIAIHNIPEGIAVSIPVYYATGSRKKLSVLFFIGHV